MQAAPVSVCERGLFNQRFRFFSLHVTTREKDTELSGNLSKVEQSKLSHDDITGNNSKLKGATGAQRFQND